MKTRIADAENRVWSLHRDYLTTLRDVVLAKLTRERPHIAIQHVLRRLRPPLRAQSNEAHHTVAKNQAILQQGFQSVYARDIKEGAVIAAGKKTT